MLNLVQAQSIEQIERVRRLFQEYAAGLGVSLCFQRFDEELVTLPGVYAPPMGRLLLAVGESSDAGCVALRPLEDGACELKRLYVRPAFRSHGLGRRMVETLVREARTVGYRVMRLDTLPTLAPAIALYLSMGFEDIPPYNDHAIPGTRYLELDLRTVKT